MQMVKVSSYIQALKPYSFYSMIVIFEQVDIHYLKKPGSLATAFTQL